MTPSEQSVSRAVHDLIQIERREGKVKRVKGSEPPTIEFRLRRDQRVISIKLREDTLWDRSDRTTRDWSWTAFIETRLVTASVPDQERVRSRERRTR